VLRLSVTARCNLACPYCCPDDRDPPDLLRLEERRLLVESAVALGVRTLRLTGGEPLLDARLEDLVAAVRPMRHRPSDDPRGRLDTIALTSNGQLLTGDRARRLRQAGLDRITLSLDGTDGAAVARMAGLRGGEAVGGSVLEKVLEALDHARAAGFDPARGELKLNAVILRGENDHQLLRLAALARRQGVELRLIEYMPVGNRNGWSEAQVMRSAEMVARIADRWPLEAMGRPAHGTAGRWRYRDGGGQLAVVASVSEPFCGDCDRLRITADGITYTCLFATSGTDLKPWLRPDGGRAPDPRALTRALGNLWRGRADRWSEERLAAERTGAAGSRVGTAERAEMAYLGG
jgi:cyclic pyranopterin phosphate synthase